MDNIYDKIWKIVPQLPKYKQVGSTQKAHTCMVLESVCVRESNRAISVGFVNRKTPKWSISTYLLENTVAQS